MKIQKILSRILDGLILLVFILFFSSAGFQDRNTSGWYQQWFPNLNGSTIKDITFLDSLTGFAVTTTNSSVQAYILKTTNGGDNWNINYTSSSTWGFRRIISTDSSTIFAVRSYTEILKTMNRGNNWEIIPMSIFCDDISIINKDTMLVVNSNPPEGGIYRSTNGGINWTRIWTNGTSGNPSKIYMYNKNLGFACTDYPFSSIFYRTSNGGLNWSNLNDSSFYGIQFLDSNNGWKQTVNSLKKSTNGGLNWIRQNTPVFFDQGFTDLTVINKDTLWYVGSAIYRYNRGLGVICKSSNGGLNWGYQLPDTSVRISRYLTIDFANKLNGWAYAGTSGVHTKTGGNDTTYYTGIKLVPNLVPDIFSLGQNYPNPFNPATNIPFELKEPSHIALKVYDIQGHEVKELVNGRWGTGRFIADFDGSGFPTGVYFYKIVIYGESTKQTFSQTKRMLMIK